MSKAIAQLQGPRELQKSGGAKSPILPHFSENSSFIAFLCDNFFGFSKSGGAAAPLDPVDTRPLAMAYKLLNVQFVHLRGKSTMMTKNLRNESFHSMQMFPLNGNRDAFYLCSSKHKM